MEIIRAVFSERLAKELRVNGLTDEQRHDINARYADDKPADHLLHGTIDGGSIFDDIVAHIKTIREKEESELMNEYDLSNTIAPLWEWEEGEGGRVDTFDYAFLHRVLRAATSLYLSKVTADKLQITISNEVARELLIITLLIFFQKNPEEDTESDTEDYEQAQADAKDAMTMHRVTERDRVDHDAR